MGMFSFNQNAGESPESIARKRKIADALLQQGTDTSPVQHWTQGLARIAQSLSGNYAMSRLDKKERAANSAGQELFRQFASMNGTTPSNSPVGSLPATGGGDTFSKMIQIESGGNPNAVSPKGATGIAQIMPATARDPGFGLKNIFDLAQSKGIQVADNSDATLQGLLRNPDVNADFGRAYFEAMKKRNGGDERLAAASYNAGPGAVDKAGGVPNFPETQAYVNKLGLGGQPQMQQAMPQQVSQSPPPDVLLGYINHPSFQHLLPMQQQMIVDAYKKAVDPNAAMDLELKQIELRNAREGAPLSKADNARIGLEERRLKLEEKNAEYERAKRDPEWEKLTDGRLFNSRTGEIKDVPGSEPVADLKDVSATRKEIQDTDQIKNYNQAAPIYRSMVETAPRNTRASDMNLVFGLGKIVDPTSVVRESDQLAAKNTASWPSYLIGAMNTVNGGAELQPDVRAAIMEEAKTRMNAYRGEALGIKAQYETFAKRYNIPFEDIWRELPVLPDFKPVSPQGSQPVVDADGWTIVDGVKIRVKK